MFGEVRNSVLFVDGFSEKFNSTSEEYWYKYKFDNALFCLYANRSLKRKLDSCVGRDDMWLKNWLRMVV